MAHEISTEAFDTILRGIVNDFTGEHILSYPGVYEILSEELNNNVLVEWERQKAESEGLCAFCGAIDRCEHDD